ncbi:hypothetical protein HYX18_00335 [Candidatus Woesearchaeota archaeon]|nr:hypothetical protein [Candidatus Woesearchaeota archaeon]
MKFSKREIFDLVKAWVLISIAFTILFSDLSRNYFLLFIVSLVTAGLGFLLHELAHKYIAQKYKYEAEFHAFNLMLLLAILFSFFGFIIAAPGAVFIKSIKGKITKRKHGIISLAGPLTNIILAIIFLIFSMLNISPLISEMGFRINSFLAFFNMLPFFVLDGSKVFRWNKFVFTLTILVSLILIVMQFL